jgi:soluble lytic murein transglycosylase-like protein
MRIASILDARWWPFAALAAATVVAIGAWAMLRHPAPSPPVVRVAAMPHRPLRVLPRPAAPKTTPLPPAPTMFDREQRMSFGQLMKRWDPLILQAAKRYAVPAAWVRAVMQAESGGRTMLGENLPMTSNMGAMGLMQLMPETYDEMRKAYRLGADPYDPHDNILAGAAYLRILRDKYGYPQMFAAYNDGPGHLEQRMMQGGLLPVETQNYVSTITARLEGRPAGVAGHGNLKLTRPDGTPVWIDGGAVSFVRGAFPGEYGPGVQSVVTVGRMNQAVREPLAQVRAAIRARGGGFQTRLPHAAPAGAALNP